MKNSFSATCYPEKQQPGTISSVMLGKESDTTERLTDGKENFGDVIKGTDLEMGIFQVGPVSSHASLNAEELSWLH